MFTLLHYGVDLNDRSPKSPPAYTKLIWNLGRFNQFKITDLDDIPIGDKYCICLDVSHFFLETRINYKWMHRQPDEVGEEITDIVIMPERIWLDSGNGLVHWIIIWPCEGNMDDAFDYKDFLKGLNCQQYPENFSFGTGSEVNEDIENEAVEFIKKDLNINIFCFNELYWFCHQQTDDDGLQKHITDKSNNIFNKKIADYKSVCYNRRGRLHRGIILAHMVHKNYLSQTIHSLGFPKALPSHFENTNEFDYLESEYLSLRNGDVIQPVLSTENIDYEVNQAFRITYTHAIHSSFHIVTETIPNETEFENRKRTFITEKSYKPFYMMQPFINFGNRHTIKTLKRMGYKTFDKWIDHSYDNEINKVDRLKKFLIEMDRLHAISDTEWADMLYDMLPDLLHNLELAATPQYNHISHLTLIMLKFFNT